MVLPILDLTNESPIEVFDGYRMPTCEEYATGVCPLTGRIGYGRHQLVTPEDLSCWSIDHSTDIRNEMERRLSSSETFKLWRGEMPSRVPNNLNAYRNSYTRADLTKVDDEIRLYGSKLTPGQVLYHGGYLETMRVARPLSTTFCPEVARQEALWKGKADKVGAVNIYIIRICSNEVTAYVYNINASSHGDELEVLISSGGHLTVGEVVCTKECFGKVYNVIKTEIR